MKQGIYWLASYPKSGNTWFRVFLGNLLSDADEPIDIDELHDGGTASSREWIDDTLGFDSSDLCDEEIERLRPSVYRWFWQDDGISYCKIHDAYSYVAGEPLVSREGTLGALYILRNPLDVAVSFAAHMRWSIEQAIAHMGDSAFSMCAQNRRLLVHTRQRLLSWSEHVKSWVDAEELGKQVIRYEDMKKKPLETFTQAASFLGLTADKGRIAKAIRFSDFGELQRQEDEKGFREINHPKQSFFRKGKIGDWKESLSETQVKKIISDHFEIMQRFGYIDAQGNPLEEA